MATKNKDEVVNYEQAELSDEVKAALEQHQLELDKKQAKREANTISLGARIMDKRVQEGSPIIDKTTNQQKIKDGIPQFYPNKYFVKLQFLGGDLEIPVEKDNHDSLEQFKTYHCTGYLGAVTNFGNTEIKPIFSQFVLI